MMYLHQMRSEREDDGTKMVRKLLVSGMKTPTRGLATVARRPTWMQRPLSIKKVRLLMYDHALCIHLNYND